MLWHWLDLILWGGGWDRITQLKAATSFNILLLLVTGTLSSGDHAIIFLALCPLPKPSFRVLTQGDLVLLASVLEFTLSDPGSLSLHRWAREPVEQVDLRSMGRMSLLPGESCSNTWGQRILTSTANSQMVQKRERESTNKANAKGEEVKGVCVLYHSCDICVGPKYFKIKKKIGKSQHGQPDKPSLFSLRSDQGSLPWGRCVARVLIWINMMVIWFPSGLWSS